jgi:hypothetical protein
VIAASRHVWSRVAQGLLRDADLAFGLAADDAGGGVQEPVAQGFGLGFREWPVQAEQEQPGALRHRSIRALHQTAPPLRQHVLYNEAPVIVGDEANRARVELLRVWLASYRPAADIADDDDSDEDVA